MDDDGDDKDDTKRRTRNLSEKKRRDQFNMLVNELSSMVSTNSRKMDKSTVLKSTISFLKNHNEITVRSRAHDVQGDWKPTFLSNEEFTYLVLEALEGFIMVFSNRGRIFYVSESIMSILGHNPAVMVNKSIFDLVLEDDRSNIYDLLQNPGIALDILNPGQNEKEIRFQCHLRRGTLDFRDEAIYELIQFHGHYRANLEQMDNDDGSSFPQDNEQSNLLFVCTCRLYTPQLIRDVSLVDTSRNEFTSRHSLEWKFLFLDHRAPPIIGYLPFEVLGTSGYDYYHFDDLDKVVTCHEALMQKGELTSCCYRFLTKSQQWIWLQTRFYITYHQWNSKPEFVVCTHRVVSYAEMSKGAKQENTETETSNETPSNSGAIKEAPGEDTTVPLSPSFMSETSDAAFGNNFQALSQSASVTSVSGGSTTGTMTTTCTTSNAAAGTWLRVPYDTTRYAPGSDTASLSGESRSSHQRTNTAEQKQQPSSGGRFEACGDVVYQQAPKGAGPAPVSQHDIGAQYLEPAPYVMPLRGMLPLPPLPVIVTPDQAQMQEQLQRKHEQLQQMIVRQQEELRQVKEQLLLARLGMLQPLINVQNPYMNVEETQLAQRQSQQVIFEGGGQRVLTAGYPPPQPPPAGQHDHLPQ